MKTRNTILTLAFLSASITITILLYNLLHMPPATSHVPPADADSVTPTQVYDHVRPAIFFLVMVLGMFFNQLFESLQKQKKAGKTVINVGETFRTGFRGITFWMALFVSPLIYFATYYLVNTMPDDRIAYFYAFQNGFFWYYVFNKFDLRAKNDGKKPAVIG